MTQEEIQELIDLLQDPMTIYADCNDEELYQDRQNTVDRVCELLGKIKPY